MIDPHEMDEDELEAYQALIDAAREARESEEADAAWQARKDGERIGHCHLRRRRRMTAGDE
jgi:hypothetical protein